jgi:hypothetical protein
LYKQQNKTKQNKTKQKMIVPITEEEPNNFIINMENEEENIVNLRQIQEPSHYFRFCAAVDCCCYYCNEMIIFFWIFVMVIFILSLLSNIGKL